MNNLSFFPLRIYHLVTFVHPFIVNVFCLIKASFTVCNHFLDSSDYRDNHRNEKKAISVKAKDEEKQMEDVRS